VRHTCRIGTEHEKLGYNLADGKRLAYEQIAALLTRIQDRFGWQPIIEDGNIIGLTQDGQSVTLEPGGQFELSGGILDTIHKTCAEVNNHLYQVGAGLVVGAAQAGWSRHSWSIRLALCELLMAGWQTHMNCGCWCTTICASGLWGDDAGCIQSFQCMAGRMQVRSVSEELGIAFLGVGFDPKWRYEDVPKMPKARSGEGTAQSSIARRRVAGPWAAHGGRCWHGAQAGYVAALEPASSAAGSTPVAEPRLMCTAP
jgi:hypothetical protein